MENQNTKLADIISWKNKYSDIQRFLDNATPQLRAFAAGQLFGLYERLMNDIIEE